MKYLSSLPVIVALLFVVTIQNASAVEKVHIANLFAHPTRGQRVVLEGRFIGTVNFETLMFSDETGQVEVVVADGNRLPERLMSAAYRVRLQGETDSGYLGTPVLLFESVEVLSHDPAQQIKVTEAAAVHQALGAALPKKSTCSDRASKLARDETAEISSLLNDRCVGTAVTLVGIFVDRVNYETLLFRDQSGEIEVIVNDDDMRLINNDAWVHPVKLRGELTRGCRQEVLIEFERIETLKQG